MVAGEWGEYNVTQFGVQEDEGNDWQEGMELIPKQCPHCSCCDIRQDYGVWYCFACGYRL